MCFHATERWGFGEQAVSGNTRKPHRRPVRWRRGTCRPTRRLLSALAVSGELTVCGELAVVQWEETITGCVRSWGQDTRSNGSGPRPRTSPRRGRYPHDTTHDWRDVSMPVVVTPARLSTQTLLLATLPAVIVGLLIRAWVMRSPLLALNSDEAITGLQAFEVLHGRFRLVVAGNDYGATTETYLIAPLLTFWTGVWPLRVMSALLSV